MKTKLITICCLLSSIYLSAFAQGTVFTYQGQLNNNGAPAVGIYDLRFTIYDSPTNGNVVGGPVTNAAVNVNNGLFTTLLDFGTGAFTGQPLWLNISVSPAGSNAFTELAPRQPITATPYAIMASVASNLLGTLPATALPPIVVTNGEAGVNFSGTFTGNGGGLTGLNAGNLTGTISDTLLAGNVLTSGTIEVTNFPSAGIYTITVPPRANTMVAKLWGAGGAGGLQTGTSTASTGGGGAFVQTTLSVVPGQTYVVVVGQHGDYNSDLGGGAGSGDAQGGQSSNGDHTGQGGQGTSLFYLTNGLYITKALAGGGGGGSNGEGGAGGNPGQPGGLDSPGGGGGGGGNNGFGGGGGGFAGSNGVGGDGYSTNAITTGITNLSSADGNGGYAPNGAGGIATGGGGYGGGGSGYSGGGGGGSYGQIIVGGTFNVPGNTGDPNYVSPNGWGGNAPVNGNDGLAVITFIQNITVTNFPEVYGPLPASFAFFSHGGRLLITAAGSGYPIGANFPIGMVVQLDGVGIATNKIYANMVIHMPFEAKTVVQNNVPAGFHTITLSPIATTFTDGNDTFNATVQELPY